MASPSPGGGGGGGGGRQGEDLQQGCTLTYIVSHDAEFVEGGLPVEQHHIVVYEMSLHSIAVLQGEVKGQHWNW